MGAKDLQGYVFPPNTQGCNKPKKAFRGSDEFDS